MQTKGRTWRKRQNKSEKATSLAHGQEYITLFQWAKHNGVFFHKMKPAIFPGTGRGLMATRQINVGDLLIAVPKRLLITEQMLRYIIYIHYSYFVVLYLYIDFSCCLSIKYK